MMLRLLSTTLLLALSMSAVPAHAVREIGNGGDAVVCRDPASAAITQVLFYDYYEADQIRRIFPIGFAKSHVKYEDYLKELFTRLERLNPSRAKLYRAWYADFAKEVDFIRGVTLVDIPDTGDGYVPNDCKLEQLVVQRVPRFRGEMRYTFNLDLFEQLSERDKAGIIFHELAFREMLAQVVPHTDSINTRVFNSMISSLKFDSMKLKDYLAWLADLRVQTGDAQFGVPIAVDDKLAFHDDNLVATASPISKVDPTIETMDLTWRGQSIRVRNPSYDLLKFTPDGHLIEWRFEQPVQLDIRTKPHRVGGQVSGWTLQAGGVPSTVNGTLQVETPAMRGICDQVEFDKAGHVLSCSQFTSNAEIELLFDGKWQKVQTSSGSRFKFAATGPLIEANEIEIDKIETATFRGRCTGGTLSRSVTGHLRECKTSEGEIRIDGKWMPLIPLADWNGKTKSGIQLGNSGALEEVDAYLASVKTPVYEGSCAGLSFDRQTPSQISACKEGREAQISRGKIQLEGKWYEHVGSFESTGDQILKISKTRSLRLSRLEGDVQSVRFTAKGLLQEAVLLAGANLKQISPPQSQWLTCVADRSVCRAEFSTNEILQKIESVSFTLPFVGSGSLEFYPSGELREYKGGYATFQLKGREVQIRQERAIFKVTIEFAPTMKVKGVWGELAGGQLETPSGVALMSGRSLKFYEDETVESMELTSPITLATSSGPKDFRANTKVRFDRNGNASEVF